MKTLMILVLSFGSTISVAATLNVTKGHVEFLAIGKPSAIKIRGKGDSLKSEMTYDKKTLNGKFTFDLNSLDTGIDTRNGHMKEKYLETGKFKDAELTLKPLTLTQDLCKDDVQLEKNSFEGTLKVHGVEKPITGDFDLTSKKSQGTAKVRFNLLITDYKIDIPSYMGIKVADKVENTVDLEWTCKE